MADSRFVVLDRVRAQAMSLGEAGRAWLATLDDQIATLARDWELTLGRAMSGGTESIVVEATMADGREAVLKIGLPGIDPTSPEARALRTACGRGLAHVCRRHAP